MGDALHIELPAEVLGRREENAVVPPQDALRFLAGEGGIFLIDVAAHLLFPLQLNDGIAAS